MRKMPIISTTNIPEDMIPCSTSRGILRPPRAASRRINANVPPSNAGNGNKFIAARLRLITAANWKRPSALDLATSAPTAMMATGPDTFSADCEKLSNVCLSPSNTVPVRSVNSRTARTVASARFWGRTRVTRKPAWSPEKIPPPSLEKKSYNSDSWVNESNSFNPSNSSCQDQRDTNNQSTQGYRPSQFANFPPFNQQFQSQFPQNFNPYGMPPNYHPYGAFHFWHAIWSQL